MLVVEVIMLPPVQSVLRAMVLTGAMVTVPGQRVESALWQSVVDSTQLPPAPSVPRVMVHPGATETACGQRVDYAVIV